MKKIFLDKKILKINFKNLFLKHNLASLNKNKICFFYKITNTLNYLNLNAFFFKQNTNIFFKKNNFTAVSFNITKKQLFINFFDFLKNQNNMSISTGVFLSYLNIKIKFIKNNLKGWFLFLNFLNKKIITLKYNKNNIVFILKGLKKKINIIFQKILQIFYNNNVSYFYFITKIKKYEKIKKFIKRRIKKKLIKIENMSSI